MQEKDIIIKAEIIQAISCNITKFSNEYINNELKQYYSNYFRLENSDLLEFFDQVKIVFLAMLSVCEEGYLKGYTEILKFYLSKFVLIKEKDSNYSFISANIPFDYVIEKSDVIIKLLRINNEDKYAMFYVAYIIDNILDKDDSTLIVNYDQFNEIDYKQIYFKNIDKFFSASSKKAINKYILQTFFNLFSYEEAGPIQLLKLSLKHFKKIIQNQAKIDNKEFFTELFNNFDKIERFLTNYDINQEWRDLKDFIIAVER
jgi:hypothetical protein